RVEGGDLIDFHHAEAHLLRQRAQMGGGQVAVFVLNEVEVFDQMIALNDPVTQQSLNVSPTRIVKLASLGRNATLAATGFPYAATLICAHVDSSNTSLRLTYFPTS